VAILPSSAQIVSFGVFTADLRSGELYKNGIKVRLERQPFHVLSMLLETPGELVSREELRNRLWPQDTFVDFDHALNTAITKIRAAVGDESDNHGLRRPYHDEGTVSLRLSAGSPVVRRRLLPKPA